MAINNLDTIPIFLDLDDQELKDVSDSCTPRTYPKNSMIILEEEFGDIVFIIVLGTVKITRVNDEEDILWNSGIYIGKVKKFRNKCQI